MQHNSWLAEIVAFQERTGVTLAVASFVLHWVFLCLNVTFDALTQNFSMCKRDNSGNRCWLAPSSYNSGVNDMPPSLDTTKLLFVHLALFWTWLSSVCTECWWQSRQLYKLLDPSASILKLLVLTYLLVTSVCKKAAIWITNSCLLLIHMVYISPWWKESAYNYIHSSTGFKYKLGVLFFIIYILCFFILIVHFS